MPDYIAYRLAAWDTPLWVGPNPRASRFNRANEGPTQYLSLHPLTPWAEYLRGEERRTEAALSEVRLRVWALRVHVDDVLAVDFGSAADAGLRPADLVADDHRPCQALATRLRADPGLSDAIEVPSAALPGTHNLVIFGPRVAAPYLGTPVDEIDVPLSPVAEDARAVASLLPLVRYRGQRHAGLEAWRRGRPFKFVEPPVR